MSTLGLVFFGAVALALVVVYGYVLGSGLVLYRRFRDARSRHDVAIDAGLFICAVAIAGSILLVFIEAGTFARFGISALFMGAFLGTGLVIIAERRNRARKGGSDGTPHVPPPYDPAGNH